MTTRLIALSSALLMASTVAAADVPYDGTSRWLFRSWEFK